MGLWAPNHPVEFGGLGLSMVDHGLFAEAVGRSPLGMTVFGTQAPDAGNIEILHQHGTAEQRERWLRPLVDGEIRSCFSMTEPETAGSNPHAAGDHRRRRRRRLRDQWPEVVHVVGRRRRVRDRDGGHRPGRTTAPAGEHDHRPDRHARASNLVRNVSVMGHAGSGHASHGEVIYQSCRVPRTNLLGAEGGGFVIAQDRLGPGRIHHCMRWLGIAGRAFEMMCDRANERVDRAATAARSPTARSSSTGWPSSTPRSGARASRRCTPPG